MGNEQQNKPSQPQTAQAPAQPPAITLDPSLIANIVAATVVALKQQGMFGNDEPINEDRLAEKIALGVSDGIESSTRRKVSFGEYLQRGHSHFHPKPKAETPTLRKTRNYWQNGALINESTLYDEEVVLLNQITHSGRYVERLVEVSLRDAGGAEEDIHINFSNTIERQMELSNYLYEAGKSKSKFHSILILVCRAQEQERQDRLEREGRSEERRKFQKQDFDNAAARGNKPWEEVKA